MNHLRGIIPSLLIAVVFILGCSGSLAAIVPADCTVTGNISSESHNILGYYTFVCDPCKNLVHIIPQREISLHLNALKFLEPPPLLYLTMEGPPEFNGNILDIDIGLRNPYLGMHQFTGFDVCGIFISHGSLTGFHNDDLVMAGEGDTRLLNPDGYTRWWNPAEFPYDGTIFGYKDGLLGTPADVADFNCTLNGYKYFTDGLDPDEPLTDLATSYRGMFSAGQKNVRHYTIDISAGLIFNYAVDACWAKPQGDPPIDVPDDFPPIANRPEAYNVVVTELENTLHHDADTGFSGGTLRLLVDVRDHFNASDNTVYGESTSGLPFEEATQLGGGDGYSINEIKFSGYGLTHHGEGELLITVESEVSGYGGILPDVPVCAYFIYAFNISDASPQGWARTWGSDFVPSGYPNYYANPEERACGLCTDNEGNIFVVGDFGNTADFDPGPPEIMRTSNGQLDAFLVKYNPAGQFQWVRTWGGTNYDRCRAIFKDNLGNIFVTGEFMGTVDFDPGDGVIEIAAHSYNYSDGYLIKFNPEGLFEWVKTWGGTNATVPAEVRMDSTGDIYVVGEYLGTADFDPGPGVDNHYGSDNWFDSFILKLGPSGEHIWARTWGAYGRQSAVDIDFDSSNNIYVSGNFSDTTDVDPGPGVEEHTAHGFQDAYISKFDSDGNFIWFRSWGDSIGYDQARGLTVTNSDEIFVTGRFVGAVDFDPGPDVEQHTTGGDADAFLCRFDTDGNHTWTRTWGGSGLDVSYGLIGDSSGNILCCGSYMSVVDFDPGTGTTEFTSNGGRDSFLTKFNEDGEFAWAQAWGGEDGNTYGDRATCVALNSSGNSFVAGQFEETCDFYPGPGVDNHTSNGGTDIFLAMFSPQGDW